MERTRSRAAGVVGAAGQSAPLETLEGRTLFAAGALQFGPIDADVRGFTVDYRSGVVAVPGTNQFFVAGYSNAGPGNHDFAVAKYQVSSGNAVSLVTSFGGGDGVATADLGGNDEGTGIALDTDGKILVTGTVAPTGGFLSTAFGLARFSADGTLDTTLDNTPDAVANGTGKIVQSFGAGVAATARAVAVQPSGNIVIGGFVLGAGGSDFALARFNATGTSLGTTTTVLGSNDQLTELAIQASDGAIIAAGTSDGQVAVARYVAGGSLDTTFGGGDGIASATFGAGSSVQSSGIALQSDGKILVAGGVTTPVGSSGSVEDFAIARFNADGSPDNAFGPSAGNTVTTDFSNQDDEAGNIALQTVGGTQKIIAAGTSNGRIAVARYDLSGNLDTTFGGTGKVATAVSGSPADRAPGLAVQTYYEGAVLRSRIIVEATEGSAASDPDRLRLAGYDINDVATVQPTTVYVDDNWAITNNTGEAGLTTGDTVYNAEENVSAVFGIDAFSTVQGGVTGVQAGGSVRVLDGTYAENVTVNKSLSLTSFDGRGETTISGVTGVAGVHHTLAVTAADGVKIGQAGQGFKINGIDNGAAGQENAAIYLEGAHNGLEIVDNEIVANGDLGLLGQYNQPNNNLAITGNTFSGKSFVGASPATGDQFTIPNVARPLVYIGGVAGVANTSNVTFANNIVSGLTGDGVAGNLSVAIDANVAMITGNQFTGTAGGLNASLRARGVNNNIASNQFLGTAPISLLVGGPGTGMTVQNNTFTGPTTLAQLALEAPGVVVTGNTFAGAQGVDARRVSYEPAAAGAYVNATLLADNTFATAVTVTAKRAIWANIQGGVNAAVAGDTVSALDVVAGVTPTVYVEDVAVNKSVAVVGAGVTNTTISGPIGGVDGATVRVSGNNAEVTGFTITREGNNAAQFNDPNLNSAGVAVQGQAVTGLVLHDNLIAGNRSAIDINNSNGHTIRNNVITQNHTGIIFRNQTDNLTVTENAIVDNRTVGILFLDASGGTNSPVQSAANSSFFNNSISGNWYGEIVDRQAGGSLPAAGTNVKNFSGNWFGTNSPVITAANSAEPSYAALQPPELGGAATAPAGQPDIAGPASANFDITPYLNAGTDTNVETAVGRGTYGFQGNFNSLHVISTLAQTGPATRIQEGVNFAVASGTVDVHAGTYKENVTVNKALTLLGANDGVAGRATRGAETIVLTNGAISPAGVIFNVAANNVTIDGFTLDGDDPVTTGNILGSGDDADADYAVRATGGPRSGLTLRNNVIKRVDIGVRGDTAGSGNAITSNWFDSVGNFDFGYAVSLRNNFYADVTNNLMTRVWTGVHTTNHSGAGGPAAWTISNNEIRSYASGIAHWLTFNQATPATINGNQIAAESAAVAGNSGIFLNSIQDAVTPTFASNAISGTDYGVVVWNAPTSGQITFGATNTIANTKLAGALLTNTLTNTAPVGGSTLGTGAATTLNLTGVSITGSLGAGVRVDGTGTGTVGSTPAGLVTAKINGGTISGAPGTTGVDVVGALAAATVSGANIVNFANGVLVNGGATASVTGNTIADATVVGVGAYAAGVTVQNNNFTGTMPVNGKRFDGLASYAPSIPTIYANNTFATAVTVRDAASLSSNYQPSIWANIQGGVNAAVAGNFVAARDSNAAGVTNYVEAIDVNKAITVEGENDNTVVVSPNVLASKFNNANSNPVRPIFHVHDAAATVQNLKIDGAGKANANHLFAGLTYYNASGTIDNVTVVGVRSSPLDGSQQGLAIFARNDDGAARTVTVTGSRASDYQKNGITIDGANLTANVTNNVLTGSGPTNLIAQNGVQVSRGATGTVSGNTISGHQYTGGGADSAGVILFQNATGTVVSGNTINNNDIAVSSTDAAGTLTIANNVLSGGKAGINVSGATTLPVLNLTTNTVTGFIAGGNLSSIGTVNYLTGDVAAAAETVNVTATTIGDNANNSFNYAGITTLNLSTRAGDDAITVSNPAASMITNVDGGAGSNNTLAYEGSGGDDFIDVASTATPFIARAADQTALASTVAARTHRVNWIEATIQARTVRGLGGDDRIAVGRYSGSNANAYRFEGNDGLDWISGGLGADSVYGGIGNDRLEGGAGNDFLFGDDGDDTILGGAGNDELTAGTGSNRLLGEAGNDRFFALNGIRDILDGGAGIDEGKYDTIDQRSSIEGVIP